MGNREPAATIAPTPAADDQWGVDWLRSALRRDLTPLEAKIAAWAHRTHRGIYHVEETGAWGRWLKKPSDTFHAIVVNAPAGSPGYGSAWCDLATWLRAADALQLRFAIHPGGPQRLKVVFWHENGKP